MIFSVDRDLTKYFDDYLNLPFERVQESFRKRIIIEHLEDNTMLKKSILEVGCGLDSIFNHLNATAECMIVEPIEQLLFSNNNSKLKSNIKKIPGRLEEVSHKINSKFHVIILSSLIHEIENPALLLNHCKDVLDKEGRILIVTNNQNSIHRILGVSMGELEKLDSRTSTENQMQQISGAFTVKQLDVIVKSIGMKINKIETFFPKILPHKMMQSALDSNIIDMKFLNQMSNLINFLPKFGSEIILDISHEK